MNRKLIYGVGVNDADYSISKIINGKQVRCPYYTRWCSMLVRCYSSEYQERQPSYIDCTVCDDWLSFSWFKCWMENQDWQGKQLDKDILKQGNKIYSPGTCLFVDRKINTLLNIFKVNNGVLPIGVSICKSTLKFVAECSVNGKNKKLGVFDTPEVASKVYKTFKYKLIAEVAATQDEPLKSALINWRIT